eukprot:COSAG01_NODE_23771_length_802_cov_1.270270_1_plen_156_part_10
MRRVSVGAQVELAEGTSALLMLTFVTLSRYSLDVGVPGGGALIRAPRVWGALHGLESFAQMVQHTKGQGYFILPCHIRDEPRFEYRSVMIDTARHFLNVSTILRVIDSMAINKLNVLQIHLTDDQSFPFDSRTHPRTSPRKAPSTNCRSTRTPISV